MNNVKGIIQVLKKVAETREINVIYSKELPQGNNSLYVISSTGIKLLLIKDSLINTMGEVEEIALGIGYDEIASKADKSINMFSNDFINCNGVYSANSIIVNVLAEKYKTKILEEISFIKRGYVND